MFLKTSILREKMNKINRGFSLIETIITISIASIIIVLFVGITYYLYNGFSKVETNSVKLKNMAKFLEIISFDILNGDTYPRHPKKDFTFEENEIVFYSGGRKVNYSFNEKFNIKIESGYDLSSDVSNDIDKIKKSYTFSFIDDFYIKYYDIDELLLLNDETPYYCELYFIFSDKTKKILKMRL